MNTRTTANITEPIYGDKLYQKRARKAFPILVRQAEAGQKIYYSDLAKELQISNPRNLNFVLGSIGQTIKNLSKAWNERIPPIQCLVVNKNTELPGEGIAWFLGDNKQNFSKMPRKGQRIMIDAEMARIFSYPSWHKVLKEAKLRPAETSFELANSKASEYHYRGGESEGHLKLKNYVAKTPSILGLPKNTPYGKTEVSLPSGDSLDVSFRVYKGWTAAEVKSLASPEADIVRGLYQCVKYRAVMRAMEAAERHEQTARAVLVLEGRLPKSLVSLKNVLGVVVFDGINPEK